MVLGFLSVEMPFHRFFFRAMPPIFSTEPVGPWNGWRVTIGPDLCEPLYIAYFVDETGSSEVVKMPFLVYHSIYICIYWFDFPHQNCFVLHHNKSSDMVHLS